MKPFRNLSFKRKILLYGGFISLLSLVIACLAFLIYDTYSIRRIFLQNILTEAEVIGKTSGSALAFQDPDFASKLLAGLDAEPRILAACIYTDDGSIFARYVHGSAIYEFPTNLLAPKYQFQGIYLDIFIPISFEESRVGTLYIRSDILELSFRTRQYLWISFFVLVLSLLAALSISGVFQRVITRPLSELERTAKLISEEKDYSKRAAKHSDDELGTLTDAFNEMLTEIQIRDSALRQSEQELEQRVYERTTQLEAANKELESFAYSVSHDLRAPLRSMDGFSVALLEEYADKLDDQGKDYLQRVREASKHMAQLIDGMLELSRMTRTEMSRETVNLSALAETIFADLYKSQPERRVEFIIEPDLFVHGDVQLLRAAIENLLSNAWKFTGHCGQGKIELGALPLSETKDSSQPGPTYFVKDNGAGFDMTYADKLFGVFQRLHRANEFPGTGIGLATVERIIHRHGGRIWAEARVDEGATFYFSLPRG